MASDIKRFSNGIKLACQIWKASLAPPKTRERKKGRTEKYDFEESIDLPKKENQIKL